MQVTSISYEQLHSFGNYQNEKYTLTTALEPGEDVNAAYANLRQIVATQIDVAAEERDAAFRRACEEREAQRKAAWLAEHPGKTDEDYAEVRRGRFLDDPFADE